MFYGVSEYKGFASYVFLDKKVCEIRLPSKKRIKPPLERSKEADEIAERVNERVFLGKPFSCDYDLWGTPFQKRVCDIVRKIPQGFVMTYADVARRAGSHARPVGQTMAKNPLPLLIPCHRVVASDLSLYRYGGGLWMKKQLLTQEGVGLVGERVLQDYVKRV